MPINSTEMECKPNLKIFQFESKTFNHKVIYQLNQLSSKLKNQLSKRFKCVFGVLTNSQNVLNVFLVS